MVTPTKSGSTVGPEAATLGGVGAAVITGEATGCGGGCKTTAGGGGGGVGVDGKGGINTVEDGALTTVIIGGAAVAASAAVWIASMFSGLGTLGRISMGRTSSSKFSKFSSRFKFGSGSVTSDKVDGKGMTVTEVVSSSLSQLALVVAKGGLFEHVAGAAVGDSSMVSSQMGEGSGGGLLLAARTTMGAATAFAVICCG